MLPLEAATARQQQRPTLLLLVCCARQVTAALRPSARTDIFFYFNLRFLSLLPLCISAAVLRWQLRSPQFKRSH